MIWLLILPILLKIAEILCCCSTRATNKINEFKIKHVYYNIYLRFILEAYLELSLVSLLRIKVFNFGTVGDTVLTVLSLLIFTLLTIIIVITMFGLRSNHSKIKETNFINKYGALVLGLSTREISAMYFPSVFMLNRLIYALIIVMLSDQSYFQIQIFVFMTSLIMAF